MTVSLIGAGPGDPRLITVRGLELIRGCEVLVHDTLVSSELVEEAPAGALVISRAGLGQEEINRLLVRHGLAGRRVVRLKGGDPFVFGRGSEEALALLAAGVEFEVVPGISSIAAVPASALIPVTHRGLADTVTIATGTTATGGEPDYRRLARVGGTLVVFMAGLRLERVTGGLVEEGLAAMTPAAVVSRGTYDDQESVIAPLGEIAEVAARLPGPALLVVGDVVTVGQALAGLPLVTAFPAEIEAA